jgi:hypothetical protein
MAEQPLVLAVIFIACSSAWQGRASGGRFPVT